MSYEPEYLGSIADYLTHLSFKRLGHDGGNLRLDKIAWKPDKNKNR